MSQQRKKKVPFILIDVVIASILFAVLLAVIFGIFWRYSQVNQILVKQQQSCERLLIAQTRLQNLFTESVFQKNLNHYFYIEDSKSSGSSSIVFTFDNNIDSDEAFCCDVLGKIYLDEEKLCLALWPHENPAAVPPTQMHKEILLENISSLQIELFATPQSKKKKSDKEEIQVVEGKWVSKWPIEYKRRPSLIKLICQRPSGEVLSFWFFIPNEIQTILYPK